jgi:hypothetical protein
MLNDIIIGYSDGFAHTAPVGSFPPNRAGLFDMTGNVWQWCDDTYNSRGKYHVARGGSWVDAKPSDLASSYRNPVAPGTRSLIRGFRCRSDKGGALRPAWSYLKASPPFCIPQSQVTLGIALVPDAVRRLPSSQSPPTPRSATSPPPLRYQV